MPFTEMEKLRSKFGGKKKAQRLYCDQVKYEINIKTLHRDFKSAIGYVSLETQGGGRAGDINLEVMNI